MSCMNFRAFLFAVLATAAAAGEPESVPLFEGLGDHHRKVATTSERAQRYFDQGLTWTHAFNHDEAIRSFAEAARLDPDCAMAWWGIAYCHGPHINNPVVPPERSKAAWAALQEALKRRDKALPLEKKLIDALAKRYADPAPEDRSALDAAYAEAMGEVYRAHKNDADVAHLYAESLMDLQPWDLWTKDGEAKGRTGEILAVLEEALRRDPRHRGAHHLYIHAVEAGPTPELGIPSADYLRDAAPGSGHLTHMPAHIDVQVGQWAQASVANEKAIASDALYRAQSPRQGFYRLYMLHNHHFLSWASMMQGRSREAIEAARAMIATLPEDWLKENAAVADGYMPIAIEALMRFGRWDDLLAEPRPPEHFPIWRAKWRFARAIAYGAKGMTGEGRKEQALFREDLGKVPADAMMAINKAHTVLSIADGMLEGELCFREGRIDDAVKALRAAVEIEDGLLYMEPPDWIQPVRHTLGAVLVSAGRIEEAEKVYLEDLGVWPENGWALFGLHQCLQARGAEAEAAAVKRRFARTWAKSDVEICATCLCVPMKPRG